ncbi:MAG: hypothetical protein ACE14V_05545 [bacterium]
MQCPKCNQDIPERTSVCPKCGIAIEPPATEIETQNKEEKPSGLALTGFILSIISIAFCCLFFIPLILNLIELRRIKKGKSSKSSKKYASAGLLINCIVLAFLIFLSIFDFVPSYFAAQDRSKVSRAKGEQNQAATALEAYYKEHKTYPAPDYDNQGNPVIPHTLTTPISYLTQLPFDPFSGKQKQRYHYFAGPGQDTTKTYWIITSIGPDKKMDLDISQYNPADPYWQNLNTATGTYDPTNGTVSSGDVWRLGP